MKLEFKLKKAQRAKSGSSDIFKYWVDFAGQKVLLKQEKVLDGTNGTIYSDLIMGAICQEMGVPSAKTDLFKFKDFRGIMSFSAFDPSKEALIMTRELIGDIPTIENSDIFDFELVEEKLKDALKSSFGLSDQKIHQLLLDRKLQKILQLYSCEMDNHLENEGFLFSRDDEGRYQVRVCPMFDNELSFGLSTTIGEIYADNLTDGLEYRENTQKLRKIYRKIENGEKLTPEEEKKLASFKEKDELIRYLVGNTNLRNRLLGNGKQLFSSSLEDKTSFNSLTGTLRTIYSQALDEESLEEEPEESDSPGITLSGIRDLLELINSRKSGEIEESENQEDLISNSEKILEFIEELGSLSMPEILESVEEKYSIPQVIKTHLLRFGQMRKQDMMHVVDDIDEVTYYSDMADSLLGYKKEVDINQEL